MKLTTMRKLSGACGAGLLILSILLVMVLSSGLITPARAEIGHLTPASSIAAGELLVKFKGGVSSALRSQVLASAGCRETAGFSLVPGLMRASVSSGHTLNQVLASLNRNAAVAYAEPNYIVTTMATVPDDPRFPEQWALDNTGQTGGTADADIDAPEAWDLQTGTDVVVAVIDTGLDYNHEDIVGNVWSNPDEIPNNGIDDDNNGFIDDDKGWDFVNNDNDPFDDNRHGTHVSGTIAAVGNNGIGVAGVNWTARIMPLKFLDANGAGTTADAISAIQYATRMGARISNNSWGGGAFSQALYDAIQAAGAAGQLFVAAAGNDGVNTDVTPSYPASYNLDNIISVAATDDNDLLATFSNFGAVSVDLGAPGVDILSTVPPTTTGGRPGGRPGGGGGTTASYDTLSGTSMATPHVSGVAALVLASNGGLGVAALKAAVLASVDPLPSLAGITVTGGRLNAFNAVAGQGIAITPNTAQVSIGASQQFTAAGGVAPYSWSVADATVGTIDAASGLFTGLAAGATSVSAMDVNGDVGTSGAITVTAVAINPAASTLTVGDTVQLTASGGAAPYSWSSSDATIASVNASGLVTALAVGAVTITAVDANGSSGAASVTVNAAVPVVTVTPNTATVATGASLQFTAAGGLAPYSWALSNPGAGRIDPVSGLFTAGDEPASTTVLATDADGHVGESGTINVVRVRNGVGGRMMRRRR